MTTHLTLYHRCSPEKHPEERPARSIGGSSAAQAVRASLLSDPVGASVK